MLTLAATVWRHLVRFIRWFMASLAAPLWVFKSDPPTPTQESSQEDYDKWLEWMVYQRASFRDFQAATLIALAAIYGVARVVQWLAK